MKINNAVLFYNSLDLVGHDSRSNSFLHCVIADNYGNLRTNKAPMIYSFPLNLHTECMTMSKLRTR